MLFAPSLLVISPALRGSQLTSTIASTWVMLMQILIFSPCQKFNSCSAWGRDRACGSLLERKSWIQYESPGTNQLFRAELWAFNIFLALFTISFQAQLPSAMSSRRSTPRGLSLCRWGNSSISSSSPPSPWRSTWWGSTGSSTNSPRTPSSRPGSRKPRREQM